MTTMDDDLVEIDVEVVLDLVSRGKSLRTIAQHFNADPGALREDLTAAGVDLRWSSPEARRRRRERERREKAQELRARVERLEARREASRRGKETASLPPEEKLRRLEEREQARQQREQERLLEIAWFQNRIRDVAGAYHAEREFERRERAVLGAWLAEHGHILG